MSACPRCQHTHVEADARALSRFAGITGYRTADGEIHQTREDAQEWLCEQRQATTTPTDTSPSDGARKDRDR